MMNEILSIARKAGENNICDRCLGRLFGKLGHNLDNLTRGKALRLLLYLEDLLNEKLDTTGDLKISMDKVTDVNTFENIKHLLETFVFNEQYMHVIRGVLGISNESMDEINEVTETSEANEIRQTSEITETNEINETNLNKTYQNDLKSLMKNIESLADRKFIDDLKNDLPKHCNVEIASGQTDDHSYCVYCKGLFDELPNFTELVCEAVKGYEFNNFLIGCRIDAEQVAAEEELWSKLGTKYPEPMKTEFNRELGKLVGPRVDRYVNFNIPDITVLVDTRYDNISLQVASLFIYGRYRKLVRDIPQTKWPCKRCWGKGCENCNGTGKIYQTSVEELISEIVMQKTKGKAHLFHGMGREDISVRMLGNGRPFILEITEPVYRNFDLAKLEHEINEFTKGKVEVSNLRYSTNHEICVIKAAKHSKTYKITINFNKTVNKEKLKNVVSTLQGRTIKQRTPVRVSHRRADLVRERKVINMELSTLSATGKVAELKITGESGLYIKELITGDSDRTTPSLASELGVICSVEMLDVIQINDE